MADKIIYIPNDDTKTNFIIIIFIIFYYLGTSVINSTMSPPSLYFCTGYPLKQRPGEDNVYQRGRGHIGLFITLVPKVL